MKRILLTIFLCSSSLNAVAQEPHVHGDVVLNIVKENHLLEIMLISPAINIVGFERLVANAEERSAIESKIIASATSKNVFQNSSCRYLETSLIQPDRQR